MTLSQEKITDQGIKEDLRHRVGESAFSRWFDNVAIEARDDEVVFTTDSALVGEKISKTFREHVEASISSCLGSNRLYRVQVTESDDSAASNEQGLSGTSPSMSTGANKRKPPNLNLRYSFDSFVVGECNQFPHAASVAVAEKPAEKYNPLFIFGGVGLGKTHLISSIGNLILHNNSSMKICYVSAEHFTNEMIHSMRHDKMYEFKKKYRNGYDVLLMDDIQFIAGKGQTQNEFFHTFNAFYETKRQIVLTSDKPPKDIPDLQERIISRFEWGLIADILPPNFETKFAILKKKAEYEGIELPDDIAEYLATLVTSNIRELEGMLTRVVAYSSLMNTELTLDMAKEALSNLAPKERVVTIEDIQSEVANLFNIKVSDLKSSRKHKIVAFPRQIAMYLSRRLTNASYPDIGNRFGGKDHSTVVHAFKKIESKIVEDKSIRNTVQTLEKNLST